MGITGIHLEVEYLLGSTFKLARSQDIPWSIGVNLWAASGFTKVVDYEPEQRGPLYANTIKASLRNLLKNLSADEYLEKMQDPQFRAFVDRLEEK